MSKSECNYPREFSTHTVDPAWLLGKVRPVQDSLRTYERWVEDHGWSAPVAARELLTHVFDRAFSLSGWLEILLSGEAKATCKQTGLCSVVAILDEACSGILQESAKVRWADDELRVTAFKSRTKPIRFSAAILGQLTLTAESLEAWVAKAADAPDPPNARRKGAPVKYPESLKLGIALSKKGEKDVVVFRKCKEQFGDKETLPKTAATFMRTVRRHAAARPDGHK